MPSTAETILLALHAALDAGTAATVLRGEALPEVVPPEGLLILRDGDPGEPQMTMSPLRYHFEHVAMIEVIVQGTDTRDARFDGLKLAIGAVIGTDRTLGGLCDWIEAGAPEPQDLAVLGADTLKAANIPVVLHYMTANPLT